MGDAVRSRSVFGLLVLMGLGTTLAVTPSLPRHPAPSPDGRRIAFSWQGDLFIAPSTGGSAQRLTSNPAYDHHPRWLPDGKGLLFSSDREGGDDLFVIELAGAPPRRLTFHEAADMAQGILGSDAVFLSRRHVAWDRQTAVYRVPLSGGTEKLAVPFLALEAVPSPDGRRLALVRGSTPADRRHYRGSANRDIWLLDLTSMALDRLTRTEWDEDGVSWAGNDALVYRSDEGTPDRRLVRMDLASRNVKVLAAHPGQDVRAPMASADGCIVAYELWDAIWVVPADGSAIPHRLEMDVPADDQEPALQREVLHGEAEETAVSPDGTQVALVLRGDVWVVSRRSRELSGMAEPLAVRVTDTPGRERDVAWSPDGHTLVYASDRNGQLDIWAARPAGREDGNFVRSSSFKETRLTETPGDEFLPRFSPDGKKLAWVPGKGGLTVADAEGKNPHCLFTHWERTPYAWSPDSRWIAFSRLNSDYNRDIFVIPSEGGAEINVTRHPGVDDHPSWSPDGRMLVWSTNRHGGSLDLWATYLTRADWARTPEEWIELFEDEGREKTGAKEAGKADQTGGSGTSSEEGRSEKPEKPARSRSVPRPVVLEAEGIFERSRPLTTLPGDETESVITSDGRMVIFVAAPDGERDLYRIRRDGKELRRLTTGGVSPSQLSLSKDGKTIFYRSGKGLPASVDLEGKAGDPVSFTARFSVSHAAWRAQVFDEAWRELDRWFADPAFHGENWKDLHDRYRSVALAATARRDYDDVINLMLGELNASHMGFRPPARGERVRTGDPGLELEPDSSGRGIRVTEVLADTPASRPDADFRAGDRILAVDGRDLTDRDNFWEFLSDRSGRRTSFIVEREGKERTVTLSPLHPEAVMTARYRTWVKQRRALVDRWSGGKLGYIHIQGMDILSLEDFERDLCAAAEGRQGLLIDVRNNGGGWTCDHLMAILTVRRHAWTLPRDGDPSARGYPADRLPLAAWTRPAAVLCDEASYSNAEIFSWAFKTLGRGSLIGMPTFGAVMSTDPAILVDGSTVRLPSRRWFVAGSGIEEENHGCPPDVVVEQPPAEDCSSGLDTQLQRAVEVLVSQLPRDPSTLPW